MGQDRDAEMFCWNLVSVERTNERTNELLLFVC